MCGCFREIGFLRQWEADLLFSDAHADFGTGSIIAGSEIRWPAGRRCPAGMSRPAMSLQADILAENRSVRFCRFRFYSNLCKERSRFPPGLPERI